MVEYRLESDRIVLTDWEHDGLISFPEPYEYDESLKTIFLPLTGNSTYCDYTVRAIGRSNKTDDLLLFRELDSGKSIVDLYNTDDHSITPGHPESKPIESLISELSSDINQLS